MFLFVPGLHLLECQSWLVGTQPGGLLVLGWDGLGVGVAGVGG